MAKIPKVPDEVFTEFCEDMKRVFGDDLVSVMLFGSGARGEYIPKKSDINFLVVVKDNSPSELAAAIRSLPRLKQFVQQRRPQPGILRRDQVSSLNHWLAIDQAWIKSPNVGAHRFLKDDVRRGDRTMKSSH